MILRLYPHMETTSTPDFSPSMTEIFPLLREMGANTVRLWTWNGTADHVDFLDKAYNEGSIRFSP